MLTGPPRPRRLWPASMAFQTGHRRRPLGAAAAGLASSASRAAARIPRVGTATAAAPSVQWQIAPAGLAATAADIATATAALPHRPHCRSRVTKAGAPVSPALGASAFGVPATAMSPAAARRPRWSIVQPQRVQPLLLSACASTFVTGHNDARQAVGTVSTTATATTTQPLQRFALPPPVPPQPVGVSAAVTNSLPQPRHLPNRCRGGLALSPPLPARPLAAAARNTAVTAVPSPVADAAGGKLTPSVPPKARPLPLPASLTQGDGQRHSAPAGSAPADGDAAVVASKAAAAGSPAPPPKVRSLPNIPKVEPPSAAAAAAAHGGSAADAASVVAVSPPALPARPKPTPPATPTAVDARTDVLTAPSKPLPPPKAATSPSSALAVSESATGKPLPPPKRPGTTVSGV